MSLVRINLAQLYPPFIKRVLALQAACASRGQHYYLTSGYRSWLEQTMLYAQGRTKPGPIVTNSKPGYSFHSFGLAVDFTHDADLTKAGLQPDWKPENYQTLGDEAVAAGGLNWGGSWTKFKDLPHIEFPLPSGVTLATLRTWHDSGGLPNVWKQLDALIGSGG